MIEYLALRPKTAFNFFFKLNQSAKIESLSRASYGALIQFIKKIEWRLQALYRRSCASFTPSFNLKKKLKSKGSKRGGCEITLYISHWCSKQASLAE